jgi:hypothetical protein
VCDTRAYQRAKLRAQHAGQRAVEAAREADRAEAHTWSLRMEGCQCRFKFPQKRRSKIPQLGGSSVISRPSGDRWLRFWVADRGGAAVCTEKLNPRVAMVKSGQDGVRTYGTGSLNRPRIRRIFV